LQNSLLVFSVLALIALAMSGCEGTEDESGKTLAPRNSATAEKSVAQKELPSVKLGSPQSVVRSKEDAVRSTNSRTTAEAEKDVSIETLEGFKTPAEYLTIKSKNFPNAVSAVSLPQDYKSKPNKKFSLLIAFAGAGESARPPKSGALAWLHFYKVDEAVDALGRNRLQASDFRGLVKDFQLDDFNGRLKRSPFRGIILVCPYSPPLAPTVQLEYPEYEKFIIDELIPELKKRYRVDPHFIGVDGVSMGGARAMYYGLKYPEIFTSIGSLQGAFGPFMEVYGDLVAKNKRYIKSKTIQLVTSDGDTLAPSVERMHRLLVSNEIPHEYKILTGPHDYIFNQGPGALSMLLFHNEASQKKVKPQSVR
jgi:iron(III)-salmochelin esterase